MVVIFSDPIILQYFILIQKVQWVPIAHKILIKVILLGHAYQDSHKVNLPYHWGRPFIFSLIHLKTGSTYSTPGLPRWLSGSIPGAGRSPGVGNGNQPQYSCLEDPIVEEPGGLQSMESQRVRCDWAHTYSTLATLRLFVPKYSLASHSSVFSYNVHFACKSSSPPPSNSHPAFKIRFPWCLLYEVLPKTNLDTCTHTNMSQTALSSTTHSPFVHRWTITYIILGNHCLFICFLNKE